MNEIFLKRRSVRRYTEQPVEEEKLKEIFQACQIAPTWKNEQCWKFIIVKEQNTKLELQSALPETNPAKKSIAEAPLIIVCCADPTHSGIVEDKYYYLVDVGTVMEHLCLQAADLGLGTCWVGLFDGKKVKEALKIPDNIRAVAMTPLGYPLKEAKPISRKNIAELVCYEKWL